MVCLLVFLVLDLFRAGLHKTLERAGRRAGIGALSQTLREKARAGDTLWCGLGDNAKYYLESGLLSPPVSLYLRASFSRQPAQHRAGKAGSYLPGTDTSPALFSLRGLKPRMPKWG